MYFFFPNHDLDMIHTENSGNTSLTAVMESANMRMYNLYT